MSSKALKKKAAKVSNVTKKKPAVENRRGRGRPRKNVKPTIVEEKIEITSPKNNNIDIVCKDTPLQSKVNTLIKFVERVEYYPDKLKREVSNKKVLLKPQHNYKIIATSNKRKLTVPQKGFNSPSKTCTHSVPQQPSMIEMVNHIEKNHILTDEDFMEILTCPSPVWWEDPPDEGYIEDAICSRNSDSTEQSYKVDTNKKDTNKIKQTNKKQDITKYNTPNKNNKRKIDNNSKVNDIKKLKIAIEKNNTFNDKKQKLENVLGCIKNTKNNINFTKNDEIKNDSNSTDGDMSDLSYNEEEILKNLENLDIPVLHTNENSQICRKNTEKINNEINLNKEQNEINVNKKQIKINLNKEQNEINLNKEQTENLTIHKSLVPKTLPPLKRKPLLKNEVKNCNPCSDYTSESDFRLLTNNEIIQKNLNSIDSQNNLSPENYEFKEKQIKMYFENDDKEMCTKKPISELAEYVTVYKIVSNDNTKKLIKANSQDNKASKKTNEKKNMNSFFKKCKNNKRLKMSCTPPASSTNLNLEKENSDEQIDCSENGLKTCEYCVVKAQNGVNNFSCVTCEKSPLFRCDICIAPEKSISSCKEIARMSWKHNYLVNET